MRAMTLKFLRVPCTSDADNKAEVPAGASLDSRDRILDDDRSGRING
jgi:hypothetical protein